MAKPDQERLNPNSYLFTVRLWPEKLDGGQREWRGKVQHVMSGEVRYFRDWFGLTKSLQELLQDLESNENAALRQKGEDYG